MTVVAAVSRQLKSDQVTAVLQWAAIAIQSSIMFNEIKIYEELKCSTWV